MRHVLFANTEIVLAKSPLVSGQTRKGIFRVIIEALHYSRRLQAERFLRQNRDLLDTANAASFVSSIPASKLNDAGVILDRADALISKGRSQLYD